jgi:hypothetical protein
MIRMKSPRNFERMLALVAAWLCLNSTVHGQFQLQNMGSEHALDLNNSYTNTLVGPFMANAAAVGSAMPGAGDLHANAWAILNDGSSTNAINAAATFGQVLMPGEGFNQFPPLPSIGLHATTVNGQRAFGFHPSGTNFTSGALTLRIQNLTGSTLNALEVAYDTYVYNDRDRSNSVNLYYSTSNAASSYTLLPAAAVVSDEAADANPQPELTAVSQSITGLNILPNSFIFIRWVFEDVSGNGERDEFLLTRLRFTPQSSIDPLITADVNQLELHQIIGQSSQSKIISVSGSNLLGDAEITVPAPFQVSLDDQNFGASLVLDVIDVNLNPTPVFVRMNTASEGVVYEDLSISSEGASSFDLFLAGTAHPPLYINEFMAVNSSTIADAAGEFDDWIELYNPHASPINLAGYYLTDDLNNLTQYRIPTNSTAQIGAGGFVLIWADDQSSQGDLHTNFALSVLGESVVLVGTDGQTIIDAFTYDSAAADESMGRAGDGEPEWINFINPTPNASNNSGAPFLSASPIALNGFNQTLGTPSNVQSFVCNGQNLFEAIDVAVNTPFEIALNSSGPFMQSVQLVSADGALNASVVYVRLNGTSLGNFTENAVLTGSALEVQVQLNGTIIEQPNEEPLIYINEFMASNSSTLADEFGEFNDWIELYNPNPFAIDLAGYYISDDLSNLTKYQIPENSDNAVIAAFGWLLIWADNQVEQGDLHASFALSALGEDLVFTAPDGESIIDAYTFNAQTQDVSEGRATDGAPNWVFFDTPTPNASNGETSVQNLREMQLVIYPNPGQDLLHIRGLQTILTVEIIGLSGQTVLYERVGSGTCTVNTSGLASGGYAVKITTQEGVKNRMWLKY